MQSKSHYPRARIVFAACAFVALCEAKLLGAPFGMANPNFNAPRFTAQCYPSYCFADGRGGLLWSFVNVLPNDLVGASSQRVGGLVRTTSDGILDTNFVVGPALQESFGVAVQTDGKVLVGGRWVGDRANNGFPNYRVFRFLTNGAADPGYHAPVFAYAPRFLTLQADGKLLVGNTQLSGTPAANGGIVDLARLNSDGSEDTGFQRPSLTGGLAALFSLPVADTNGLIYIAGGFSQVNGQNRLGLARLLPNGTLDSSFTPSGFTFSLANRGIVLQPEGKVVIGGRLRIGATYYPLARLNQDGGLDASFNLVPSSWLNYQRLRKMVATPDGKIVAIDSRVVRFNSDGTLDTSFAALPFGNASDDSGSFWECPWLALLPDGRVVVPSDPTFLGVNTIGGQPFNGSVRLLDDGTVDPTYSQPVFRQEIFPAPHLQSDGRVLVAGGFDRLNGNPKRLLARLNADGSPDLSYTLGVPNAVAMLGLAPVPGNQSYALVQAGDLVYGSLSNVLARLQPDGSVDAGFALDPGLLNTNGYLYTDLMMQGQQPVLLGSPSAQAVLAQTNFPMARFLTNGAWDPSLHCDLPATGILYSLDGTLVTNPATVTVYDLGEMVLTDLQPMAVLPDGRFLAALGTTNAGGTYTYQLLRLTANGALDGTFSNIVFSPADSVLTSQTVHDQARNYGFVQCVSPVRCLTAALVQSNAMVLVGGAFTNAGGVFRAGIARLLAGGALDPGFPLGSGPTAAEGVTSVKISGLVGDAAGKIWVTGNFAQWDGFPAPGYVRLNADGSVDTNCVPQGSHYGVDDDHFNAFSGVLPDSAAGCFVWGPHLLPGDVWPRGLTRLMDYLPPPLRAVGLLSGTGFEMTFNSESGRTYWLQTSADLQTWQNSQSIQGTGARMTLTDPAALSLGKRFYRVVYQ
jgi:uncharacterized delta-60 repeat protein